MKAETVYEEILSIAQLELNDKFKMYGKIPKSGEFEDDVVCALTSAVKKWNNAHSEEALDIEVQKLSVHKFPNIVLCDKTNGIRVGVEVKLHKSSKVWETKGKSAFASTQESGLDEIYLLFGNFALNPPEFRWGLFDACVDDLETTHKPRYHINMGKTNTIIKGSDFFDDKMKISYKDFRELDKNQREAFANYYLAEKKSMGHIQRHILAQCFAFFPEIFSANQRERYKRMGAWLSAQNIICRNARDYVSARGKKVISIVGDEKLPRVFFTLYEHKKDIINVIKAERASVLAWMWYGNANKKDRIPQEEDKRLQLWLDLVCEKYGGGENTIDDTPYKFRETLKIILGI